MRRRALLAGISMTAASATYGFPRGHVSSGTTPPSNLIPATINGVPQTNTLANLVAATPSGGTLAISAGTYTGTSYVTLPMTITGAGKGLTIISGIGVSPSGSKACLVATVNGVTVSNMSFQDFAISNGLGGNACAVRGDSAGIGVTMTNLSITRCQDGILTTSGDWTITGTDFSNDGNGNPGSGSTHEQYFGSDPGAHVIETNVISSCGPLATHAFKSRSGHMTLLDSTYTGNSTDPTFGVNAGAVIDVPECGALLATTCTFNMPAGSSNPQWLNYGVDSAGNSASGMTASFQNCVFNSGVAGVGGVFQAFRGGCTLDVTGSVYTNAVAPTFTGWASVIGTMTRATLAITSSPGTASTNSQTAISAIFIGDSITLAAPSGGADPVPTFASHMLAEAGITITGSNQGIGGFTSGGWLPSNPPYLANAKTAGAALSPPATYAFYMIGTNDSSYGISSVDYVANIVATANDLVAAGYTVVLNQLLYSIRDPTQQAFIATYAADFVNAANGTTILVGDTKNYAWSLANNNPTYFFDGTHPNPTGDAVMAANWALGFPARGNGATINFSYNGAPPDSVVAVWNPGGIHRLTRNFSASGGTGSVVALTPAAPGSYTVTLTGTGPNIGSSTSSTIVVS